MQLKVPQRRSCLGVFWLGCWDFTAAAWVQSLPIKLRSHKPCDAPKKKKILQCTKQSPQLIITKSCDSRGLSVSQNPFSISFPVIEFWVTHETAQ